MSITQKCECFEPSFEHDENCVEAWKQSFETVSKERDLLQSQNQRMREALEFIKQHGTPRGGCLNTCLHCVAERALSSLTPKGTAEGGE